MDDLPLDGKRVLVRVDFNVSMGADKRVDETEDYRLEAALPTIQELRRRRCKVILLTHLGRPGEEEGTFEIAPVADRLRQLIGDEVKVIDKLTGPKVESMVNSLEQGGVAILPNVRLDDREMHASEKLGQDMAEFADAYINEAFSNSHRGHTSMTVLPRLLPSCAGRRTVMEVETLSGLAQSPAHPYVAITSGAKITTKIGMLRQLLTKVDKLCLGGQIANVFLGARGLWQSHPFHPDEIESAKLLLASHGDKLVLPIDVVIGDAEGSATSVRAVAIDAIPADVTGIWDVGPKSVKQILDTCVGAKTVMWNGPVGRFEVAAYSTGTKALAQQLADQPSFRVVGGGDTVKALEEYRLVNKYNHVSVGGGAMIAFLEGKRMPGLETLYS